MNVLKIFSKGQASKDDARLGKVSKVTKGGFIINFPDRYWGKFYED